jgi:glycosyltransferase involved in cell wall biosynthesis
MDVIVVDDGSTDESREVLASYGDQIVTVITENRGQAAAMNTAFDRCSGDVVCLLDSDDLMLPRRVECLIEAYAAHPECEWVFHGLDFINRNTREPVETPLRADFTPGFHDERRFVRRGWFSMNAPATSALSWRTSFVKGLLPVPARVGAFDNYLKFASLATALGWVIGEALCLQGIHQSNTYTTMEGAERRLFALHNAVAMAPGFEALGLRMLGERLVADSLVRARGGTILGSEHREILSGWLSGLSYVRRVRLAGFCAAVGADSVIESVRALAPWRSGKERRGG